MKHQNPKGKKEAGQLRLALAAGWKESKTALILMLLGNLGILLLNMFVYTVQINRPPAYAKFDLPPQDISQLLNMGIMGAAGTIVFIMLFFTVYQFRFLYNRQKLDFYLSVPSSRRVLFLSRYMQGVGLIWGPFLLVMAGLLLCRGLMHRGYVTFDIPLMLNTGMFCMAALTGGYTLMTAAAVNAGRVRDYYLLLLGFVLSGGAVQSLLRFPELFVPGYAYDDFLAFYLMPINALNTVIFRSVNWWMVLAQAATAGLLLLYAAHCFKKRRSEYAQTRIADKRAAGVCLLFIQLSATLGVFEIVYNKQFNIIFAILWGLAAGAAAAGVGIFIYYTGKKGRWKNGAIRYVAAAAFSVLIIVAASNGLFGYGAKIPMRESVDKITLEHTPAEYGRYPMMTAMGFIMIMTDGFYEVPAQIFDIVQEEEMDKVFRYHEKVIALGQDGTKNCSPSRDGIRVTYHLNNGKTFSRMLPMYCYDKKPLTADNNGTRGTDYLAQQRYAVSQLMKEPEDKMIFDYPIEQIQAVVFMEDYKGNTELLLDQMEDIRGIFTAFEADYKDTSLNGDASASQSISGNYISGERLDGQPRIPFYVHVWAQAAPAELKNRYQYAGQLTHDDLWALSAVDMIDIATIEIPASYHRTLTAFADYCNRTPEELIETAQYRPSDLWNLAQTAEYSMSNQ